MDKESSVRKIFLDSIEVKKTCLEKGFQSLVDMGEIISTSIKEGNKMMLCGNGGSEE